MRVYSEGMRRADALQRVRKEIKAPLKDDFPGRTEERMPPAASGARPLWNPLSMASTLRLLSAFLTRFGPVRFAVRFRARYPP